jgi:hypothetical protein
MFGIEPPRQHLPNLVLYLYPRYRRTSHSHSCSRLASPARAITNDLASATTSLQSGQRSHQRSGFRHRPLSRPSREIRLLTFLKRDAADTLLHFTLSHVSLNKTPTYSALSYVWGEPSNTVPIVVEGFLVDVTANLRHALEALFVNDRVNHPIWVDAICINQADDVKKNEQVQMMHHIFAGAVTTIAWTGLGDIHSKMAVEWLQSLSTLAQENGDHAASTTIHEVLAKEPYGMTPSVCATLKFLQRDYWSRVWVIQELAFSGKILVACGGRRIRLDDLRRACEVLLALAVKAVSAAMGNSYSPWHLFLAAVLRVRNSIAAQPVMTLAELLRQFRAGEVSHKDYGGFFATDKRDHIFSLLNMAYDAEELGLRADYTKPCEEVFLEANKALLRSGVLYHLGRGEILSQHAPQHPRLIIPSWASNFSYIPTFGSSREASLLFCAGGSLKQDPKFETRHRLDEVLVLRGIEIGVVGAIGPGLPRTNGDLASGWPMREPRELESWFRDFESFLLQNSIRQEKMENEGVLWRVSSLDLEEQGRHEIANTLLWKGGLRRCTELTFRYYSQLRWIYDRKNGTSPAGLVEEGFRHYILWLQFHLNNHLPFVTENGFIGMAKRNMRIGDIAVVLLGTRLPSLLRPVEGGFYQLLEQCYVYEAMDGEMAANIGQTQEFRII